MQGVPLSVISCGCTGGCSDASCVCCVKGVTCTEGVCGCISCRNPLNVLHQLGLPAVQARTDPCLMENIYQVTRNYNQGVLIQLAMSCLTCLPNLLELLIQNYSKVILNTWPSSQSIQILRYFSLIVFLFPKVTRLNVKVKYCTCILNIIFYEHLLFSLYFSDCVGLASIKVHLWSISLQCLYILYIACVSDHKTGLLCEDADDVGMLSDTHCTV